MVRFFIYIFVPYFTILHNIIPKDRTSTYILHLSGPTKSVNQPHSIRVQILKGIVSRDECFCGGPKNQNSTFWVYTGGFHIFWLSFWEENPSFCLPLWNNWLIGKILAVTLLSVQVSCSGFKRATCNSKSCSESRLWSWKLFRKVAMNGQSRNRFDAR